MAMILRLRSLPFRLSNWRVAKILGEINAKKLHMVAHIRVSAASARAAIGLKTDSACHHLALRY
jgi:hypothetical protein